MSRAAWRTCVGFAVLAFLTAVAHGQSRARFGPQSALAYSKGGGYRSPGSGPFGFTARNYIYGNYGAYQARPGLAPAPRPAQRVVAIAAPLTIAPTPAPAPATATTPVVPYYYGVPGYPSTFFQPTVQSYAPYATPGLGYTPGRAPVYAVEYGSGLTMSQSYTGYSNAAPESFNAQLGNPSYVNNRGSFGQDFFPGLAPGQVTYGQSSQAAATPPGYYGNYPAPAGATYQQIISWVYPPGTRMPLGPPPMPGMPNQ